MMKKFLISGSIVDTDAERATFEDVTPTQINAFINKLEKDDEIELEITSYGGSVSAGIAICNLLKQASANGHPTTAHVIGIAASMASAIACACDKLVIDSNAFLMLHLPWTMAVGNAIDLRKEADVLDKYRDALLAIYKSKFDLSDDILKKVLEDETWIDGKQASVFNLKCEVLETAEPLKIAASLKMPKFNKIPEPIRAIVDNQDLTSKQVVDMENNKENTEEEVQKAVKIEEEKQIADELTTNEKQPEEEMVAKAEVEKRVSGMQSAMAKQMDAMKKDYEAKIEDFKVQIEAKNEELTKAQADVTSLKDSLDKANGELSKLTSALEEKENALAVLNAGVNTPHDLPTMKQGLENCKTPAQKVAFLKTGKYVR